MGPRLDGVCSAGRFLRSWPRVGREAGGAELRVRGGAGRARQGRAADSPPRDVAWAAPAVGIPACGALIISVREETEP